MKTFPFPFFRSAAYCAKTGLKPGSDFLVEGNISPLPALRMVSSAAIRVARKSKGANTLKQPIEPVLTEHFLYRHKL